MSFSDGGGAAPVPAGIPFADDGASIIPAFDLALPLPDSAALATQHPVIPSFPATTPRPGRGHFDEDGYYHFEYPDPMECALVPIPPRVSPSPLDYLLIVADLTILGGYGVKLDFLLCVPVPKSFLVL